VIKLGNRIIRMATMAYTDTPQLRSYIGYERNRSHLDLNFFIALKVKISVTYCVTFLLRFSEVKWPNFVTEATLCYFLQVVWPPGAADGDTVVPPACKNPTSQAVAVDSACSIGVPVLMFVCLPVR